ncbi:MAG: hypothetical protein FJY66_00765 [Calditrichaeota bacterium]|nr:hypothetical protein [Calditrichota bacterium]
MAAIDLLFDVKKDSERLHQLVLGPLLIKTRLLDKLGIKGTPVRKDFEWEPRRRCFDLGIEMTEPLNSHVWVEVKVDGELARSQVERQIAETAADRLLYLLLGHSQYTTNRSGIERELEEHLPERYSIVTGDDLCKALAQPDILLGSDREHRDVRDLVASYLNWLRILQDRYNYLSRSSFKDWEGGDCFKFFACCRDELHINDMNMGYIPNPAGGFLGAWWNWSEPLGDTGFQIYLQLEFDPERGRSALCFKVQVEKRESCTRVCQEVRERILQGHNQSFLRIERPSRIGFGTWVTVAYVDLGLSSASNLAEVLQSVPHTVLTAKEVLEGVVESFK